MIWPSYSTLTGELSFPQCHDEPGEPTSGFVKLGIVREMSPPDMAELIGKFCDIQFAGGSCDWPYLNGAVVTGVSMPMIRMRERRWSESGPENESQWINVSAIRSIRAAPWQPKPL